MQTAPKALTKTALTLPLRFEPNWGQGRDHSRYIAKSGAYEIHFSPDRADLQIPISEKEVKSLTIALEGADPNAHIEPAVTLAGKSNYFLQSDRTSWLTDIPNYGQLQYQQVYPGVDLVFYGNRGRLEYDFMVAPNTSTDAIKLRIPSGAAASVDADGNLQLKADGANVQLLKPVVYQIDSLGHRHDVEGAYRIDTETAASLVKFDIGEYDHTKPLIIDPVLSYSTNAGLSGTLENIYADGAGNTYLLSNNGGYMSVTKLSSDGKTVLYNTTISSVATGVSITVDSSGQAHVVGYASSGYPTTDSSYRPVYGGSGYHIVYTVLTAAGDAMVYSTYIEGSYFDYPQHIAVDNAGKAYISGYTLSSDFPNTGPSAFQGYSDGFVLKIDPTKTGDAALIYSNLTPPSSSSSATSVAVDASLNVYVAVNNDANQSTVVTSGAYQYYGIYGYDGGSYVYKYDASGALVYTAYLGYGVIQDIAIDGSGATYVTGYPQYGDFPATAGAYQTTYPYGYVAKLDPTGATLVYSTYLGGPSGQIYPQSIALLPGCASNCSAYISGSVQYPDFPVTANAIQNSFGGGTDAFLVTLSGDGSTASFSSYLGGSSTDDAGSGTFTHIPQLRLDNAGNIYIGGNTYSTDFPFSTYTSTYTPYLVKIGASNAASLIPNTWSVNFGYGTIGIPLQQNVVLRNYGSATLTFSPPVMTSDFTEADSCGGSIVPGGSCTVQVTFTGTVAGQRYGTMTVNHSGINSPTQVQLTGYVSDQAYIVLSPTQLSFGSQPVGTSSAVQSFTVTNTGTQGASLNGVYPDDAVDFSQTNNCPSVLAVGASCTVQVTFTPSNVGTYSARMYAYYSGSYGSGNLFVQLYGTGSGVGTSTAVVSPGNLQFADQLVGTTSTYYYGSVQVTNTGTAPITMQGSTVTDDFTIYSDGCGTQATLYPASTCTIYVLFSPKTPGAHSGTLTISSSASGFPQTVNLSGNGIAGTNGISLSPASIQFNDQVLNSTSSYQSVMVTNTGTSPLTISRVYSTTPDFLIYGSGCNLTTLSQNGVCYINVEFKPTATGPLSGSIILVDTDPTSPQSIALSGNGVDPSSALYITPQSLAFDDTVPGTTSYQYVTLYNPGNTNVTVSSTTVDDTTDFNISSGCSIVYAGSYCSFYITFQPQTQGQKTATVTIVDTAAGSPHTFSLSGNAPVPSQSVIATPQSYSFDDQVVNTTSSYYAIYFYNSGTSVVNVSGASASGDFSVSNGCSTIYPGGYCVVNVQFTPTASGPRDGTLTLFDDAPGNPHTVALSGNGLDATTSVIVSPPLATFLDQVVGTTSSGQYIYFYNTGNSPVNVTSLTASGDFTLSSQSCSSGISAQSYCYAYVTFTPSAAGARTGALTMVDSAPGSPHGANLSGNGIAASKALTLSPASLDFGSLVVSSSVGSQLVYLVNSGTQPVTISSVTPSANVTASGCVTQINPGASCGMTVTFSAAATGTQTGTVSIASDAPSSPQTINVTANGVSSTPAVSLVPNGLSFDQQVTGNTSSAQSVTFHNESGATISFSGITASGDFAVSSSGCSSVVNHSTCNVNVTFTPTAAGMRTGTLTLTHNGPGGQSTAALTGFGKTSAKTGEVTPGGLAFVDQVVGTASSAQNVYLYSTGTVPINVSSVTISGDFAVAYSSCSGPVSYYCVVQVKFQPTVTGTRTGVLTINDDSSGSPHTLSLAGNGVNSTNTVVLGVTQMNFPDQPLNTTSNVQGFYLWNTGNTPVNVNAPTVTGDFSIAYSYCPAPLSPTGYCYWQVQFTPTALGPRTGTLTITSDSSSGPQTMQLAGNGIVAKKTIVVAASGLKFSDQPVGVGSNSQYFYVYNNGTLPVTFSPPTLTGDSSDFAITSIYCSVVQPNSYCYYYVQFTPTQTGTRSAVLNLNDDAVGNPQQVTLTGVGLAVTKSARLSATAIAFPDQAVNTTSNNQFVYIYNQGNVSLNLSSIAVTGDFVLNTYTCGTPPTSIGVGSYCYVYLQFTPTATGLRTGTLTFADDAPTTPQVVTLSGRGTTPNPSITASTTSLVFGTQEVGTTSGNVYLTIFSNSNVPITFGTVTSDNADFIPTSGCSSFSGPGQSCNISVNFKPSATGSETGTLTIPSNASGSPLHISLSGTGIASGTGGQFSQTSINFGNEPVGSTSTGVTVYYSNNGASSISISAISVTGDFAKSGGCSAPATIGSKGYCYFTITFTPSVSGPASGTLVITDNAPGSPHTITLSGNGVATFPTASATPSAIAFGSVLVGASPQQTVTLTNSGTAPLLISSITFSPPLAAYTDTTGCGSSLAAGSSCYVNVIFTPTSAGLQSTNLVFTDNAAGSPQTVAISGTGVSSSPIVALSSTSLGFGSYAVGSTSSATAITLYNTGNAILNISSITASAEFAQSGSCGPRLPANSNCNMNVTFTPAALGLRTGTITIVDDAPGSPHIVSLSGTGIPASSSQVSPSSLIFPNQQVTTSSSTQTITLTSLGASLNPGAISISGDFSQTNNCTGPLGYGGACYISVKFSPTTVGNRTGTLTIVDDSPTSPHLIPVSGTGTGSPAVTLSSTSLTFSSTSVGTTTAAQSVTLTNTGTGPLGISGITSSGDYAQTNNCAPNLNAGVSCTINVTFTPTTYGNRAGSISITDTASGSPHTITLSGTGLAPGTSLSSTSLTFTSQAVGSTSAAQTVTLTNPGTTNLVVSSIVSTTAEFLVTHNCTTVVPGTGSCTISVKFAPAAAGTRSATVSIVSNAAPASITVSGTGTGPVASLDKTSLNFGSVQVGSPSSTQTVTLSSTGDSALLISSITTSGDYSQTNNCPSSLAVGSNCTISVTFLPTGPGPRTSQISIADNAAGSPQVVSLSGTGLGASVGFNPTSLNFAATVIGTTSPAQSIVITNTGTTSLAFTSITASGDFSQTNNCVSPLAASASCTANVTFTPTASGARSGLLTLVAPSGSASAGLTGTGLASVLSFSPASLTFASIPVGTTSAAQGVTVTNVGSTTVNISSVAASGDFAQTTTCIGALQPSNSCSISVTFTPTQSGSRTGALTITDDAPGSPQTVPLSGTGGSSSADMAVSGSASPKFGPPGGTATFTLIATNNGPSQATNVSFTMTAPTNSSVQSVNPSAGSCTGTSTIVCTVPLLPSGQNLTVSIVVTNTTAGPMTTNLSVSASQSDPVTANNTASVTSDASVADVQLVAASTTTQLQGQPAFTMVVTNNGPQSASNVTTTYDLQRFGYVTSVASQGSCAWDGVQVACSLGTLTSGASASITIAVQPPDSGWTTIEGHASASTYDPTPTNNIVQFTPDEGSYNTKTGTNVSVDTADPQTGATANLVFATVTRPGNTGLAAATVPPPPAGYRLPKVSQTFDVSTTAQYSGNITFTLRFAPAVLWHPSEARLFHNEGGVWVDRTAALNPAGSIASVTGSLSQFAIFEPPNQAPTANAGSARVVAGTNSAGNQVQLDASQSSDPEKDRLTYKWTGPFPEGNGTVTGMNPTVTLPLGANQVTLTVNDGEVDSAPVTQSVTVSDFAVSANVSAISVNRGQTANLTVSLAPKWASYDRAVTLDCANLPADLTCQFAQASVTPGASGSQVTLTIAAAKTTAALSHRNSPRMLAAWLLAFGMPFGLVILTGDRKRMAARLAVLALVLLVLYMSGCGGGGGASSFQPPPTQTGATSNITVTATSSGIQHSVTLAVTRN